MTRLDTGALFARPGFRQLLRALATDRGCTRLVGGAVRDGLLGEELADVDLATQLPPPQILQALDHHGLRGIPTGLAHGTVTALAGDHAYEITTLRQDVETFGRHATIRFTDSWQADAARRDFTINALYAQPLTGELFDYFSGLDDLRARRVRFIGAPLQRIAEDHLRILRFFRFTARFASSPDAEGLAACTARANDLMALSRERIRDELLKLLALPAPAATIRIMLDAGILAPVLPEIRPDAVISLERLVARETQAGARPDGLRRLAALLPAGTTLAADIAARLRLSKTERQRLLHALDRKAAVDDPQALAYRIGAQACLDRLLLLDDARAAGWQRQLASYARPKLPISGRDLIALGLAPGPRVSRTLAMVEERWIAAGFPPSREQALTLAREILGDSGGDGSQTSRKTP